MAYTTPRTWVTGEVSTSGYFNSDVRDNVSFLYNKPRIKVYNSAAQSFAASTVVDVAWDTVVYDTDSLASASSPNFTIHTAGVYFISGHMTWASSTVGRRVLNLRKGATDKNQHCSSPLLNGIITHRTALIDLCAVNDTYKHVAYQTTAGALAASPTGVVRNVNAPFIAEAMWISG